MSTEVDISKLKSYVSQADTSVLLEDVSHLRDLNIVTSVIANTDNGSDIRLPLQSLTNIKEALKLYRDELGARCTNSDVAQEIGYLMLREYYNCVKSIRSLAKYLKRHGVADDVDYANSYSTLAQNKSNQVFIQSIVEVGS